MKNTNKRVRLNVAYYKEFVKDICSNKAIKDIAKKYNITANYVDNYRYCVRALNNKKDLKNNGRWSKEIISYLKTYLTENKVEIKNKDKIRRKVNYDTRQFAIDICNNEDPEDMSEFYGMSISTIQCYKNFAKAALNSEGSEIEEKIYTTLNKQVKAHIKNLLQNNQYNKSLRYVRDDYKPRQVGPNSTVGRLETKKSNPAQSNSEVMSQLIPPLNLNSCALNYIGAKPEETTTPEETPIKEIINLLQSTLDTIQALLKKL